MNELIKHKDTIYRYRDGGLIAGYVKTNEIPEMEPTPTEWKGSKMPHVLWQTILAFFNWTFIETKPSSDEALVRLYYNEETQHWLVWAPPQRGCGMTVRTVEDHPNWAQEQSFDGYVLVGTGHHHCNAKAFQSGTDSSDEKLCNGLHFTVGNLADRFVSLHARAVFNGSMMEVELMDWVDMADAYRSVLELESIQGLGPGFIHEMTKRAYDYSHQTKPASDTPFPQAWKDNYLKGYYQGSHNQGSMGFHNGHVSGGTKGYFKKEWVNGVEQQTWVSTETTGTWKSTGLITSLSTLTPSEKGESELEQLMSGGIKLIELCLMAQEMCNNPRKEWEMYHEMKMVCDILDKHGLNPRWFEKWCAAEVQIDQWQNAM